MNWNAWIRQIHRWLSIIFTLTVAANLIAMTIKTAMGPPPSWIVYSPLPFLFLLLFTGLYMFALPYTAKWRSDTRTG